METLSNTNIRIKIPLDPPTPVNLGIAGHTSNDLLARFDSDTKFRVDDQELVIVIAIGMNDARSLDQGVPKRQYIENINTLWNKAKKYSDKIVFIGLNYITQYWSDPELFSGENVKEYNDTLEQFCKENKIEFVQMYEKFKEEHQKINLLNDGIHPNEQGHAFMAKLILPKLLEITGSK